MAWNTGSGSDGQVAGTDVSMVHVDQEALQAAYGRLARTVGPGDTVGEGGVARAAEGSRSTYLR